MSYSKWTPEEQWSEAIGMSNLITGVDVPPVNGHLEGQRPKRENTIAGVQERLGAFIFQQSLINQAILKKLEIPFHLDQGAIVLD